ncbi:MAG TPA: hypothetical protein DCW72_09915 [Elusimicrobia bacterium]|nr:MAG: hypothetical protein A2X31_10945 [Elusimicrobia bacterium GWB2_63_22]HAU90502.1 hypothetical protein [Elusimicrobiota bacterium]
MRLLAPALLLLCCAAPAAAQELPGLDDMLPEPTRYLAGYINAGLGKATPFGSHWGDKGSGFASSAALTLSVSKRVDEILSYGGEVYYAGSHVNRQLEDLEVRVMGLSPFVRASFPSGNKTYYGVLGAGVYQWNSPAYTAEGTRYPSQSGSSAGLDLGTGVSIPFWWGTRAGVDLRWRHIFNMNGGGLDLGAVDTYSVMFALHYSVWLSRKAAVNP